MTDNERRSVPPRLPGSEIEYPDEVFRILGRDPAEGPPGVDEVSKLLHAQKMEAVARLTAGVAHEYNNLLMGIQGCTNLALRSIEPSHPATKFVSEAERAAQRGASLTRQLLDFTSLRERNGGGFDVDRLIERVRPRLSAALGGLELRSRLGAPGSRVLGDAARVEQVLLNLVTNARDAMPDGGTIRLETSASASVPPSISAEPGDYVVLTVSDTGVGMDEQTRERVFDPFFTTKPVGEGSGLGLSTAYGIVRAAGGDISIESEVGVGTTVTLFFRRAPEAELPIDVPTPVASLGPRRILIVEDEALILMTLRDYLERCGHEVVEATDVGEASLRLNGDEGGFDLIVTDVMLPSGTGRHVAEEARAIGGRIPVIFMSAHPAELLLADQRIPPGSTVLQKPFGGGALLAEVRRALEAPR